MSSNFSNVVAGSCPAKRPDSDDVYTIGEYIAKIYDEIKARPPYLVETAIGFDGNETLPASWMNRAQRTIVEPASTGDPGL